MTQSPFAIVNLKEGARRDVEPFLLDNDAFPLLENTYLFRGRIERRSCFREVGIDGRLKFQIGTTAASPFLTTLLNVPLIAGTSQFTIGIVVLTDPGGAANPIALLSTDPLYSGTLNKVTGALTIIHPVIAATPVIYIPGISVMDISTRELSLANIAIINDEETICFDTAYSYLFDGPVNDFVGINFHKTSGQLFFWQGTDSDFFWTTSYAKAFWATNNIAGLHAVTTASLVAERDGIRWYDGRPIAPGFARGWVNFNPQLTAGPPITFLQGGLIILPYRNRLVVLNTFEGDTLPTATRFAQRARWSQNGTPYYAAPVPTDFTGTFQADSWRSDIVGKGGFIDAPTQEEIVSSEFIKDTLVVYFEKSTWQLVYTNNEILPFYWEKINVDFGSESTFSTIPFDNAILTVAQTGITGCNSVGVQRIDQKIPDDVFNFENQHNGVKRVHGIRDFPTQLVYWTYPNDDQDPSFPNRVLVYNYLDGSWANFVDSFTCFGYFQKFSDETWGMAMYSWASAQKEWNSGALQAKYPNVATGNQRGFVFVFNQTELNGINSPSLPISQVTNPGVGNNIVLTIINHNLETDSFGMIVDANIISGLSGFTNKIFKITVVDSNNIRLDNTPLDPITGTYLGGALFRVIPDFSIQTKLFNPFYEMGKSARLTRIEVLADRTEDGQITFEYLPNYTFTQVVGFNRMNTSPDDPASFQFLEDRIWHRVYSNVNGSFIQLNITLNDDYDGSVPVPGNSQIRNLNQTTSDVTIHGLLMYMEPTGRMIG